MTDGWQISRIGSLPLHLLLVGGLLVLNLLLCFVFMEQRATAWDPLGYQVAGQAIARGLGPITEHPFNGKYGPYFALAAFGVQNPLNPSQMYLNYPPGFPVLLAVPQWLGLPDYVMMPALSALGLLGIYGLGRILFDKWTGLLGAAIAAFTPVYLEWGSSLWSDLPGMCFTTGALVVYLAAIRKPDRAWQISLGAAAAVLAIMAVFIKYSNILIVLPLTAYAIVTQRKALVRCMANGALAVTVAAGLMGVGLYNYAVYGSPFETFYAASRSGLNFPTFSLAYALGPSPADGYSLIGAGRTLWSNFTWLLAPAALGLWRSPRGAKMLLGMLFLVYLGLSSVFAWAPENVDTRYLLPLFPAVALWAARGCLSIFDRRLPRSGWALAGVLAAAAVTYAVALPSTAQRLEQRNRSGLEIMAAMHNLTAGSERDAVFLAYLWNDALNYFGERTTLFYRRINANDADFEAMLTRVVAAMLRDGVPVYYVEDRQPSYRDSLRILQRAFHVSLWKNASFPIYRITSASG